MSGKRVVGHASVHGNRDISMENGHTHFGMRRETYDIFLRFKVQSVVGSTFW